MNNKKVNKFGSFVLETDESLKISLANKTYTWCFLILSPLIYIALFIWLLGFPLKKVSLTVSIVAILLLLIGTFSFFYSLYKSYKNLKDLLFEKKDGFVIINHKKICNQIDLKKIIIQPKSQIDQIPTIRCTIGIEIGNNRIPLSYDHNPKNVHKVANALADYLGCEVEEKKMIHFPLFTKW